jgi:hypothetical protein
MMNSRTKGHDFERKIAAKLRDIWPNCITSRAGNPQADQSGVDLVNTSQFNFQLKAMERSPTYHSILDQMPKDGNYNVILHKRNRKGIIAVMYFDDFIKIIKSKNFD